MFEEDVDHEDDGELIGLCPSCHEENAELSQLCPDCQEQICENCANHGRCFHCAVEDDHV